MPYPQRRSIEATGIWPARGSGGSVQAVVLCSWWWLAGGAGRGRAGHGAGGRQLRCVEARGLTHRASDGGAPSGSLQGLRHGPDA
jgi:hypothetical protein